MHRDPPGHHLHHRKHRSPRWRPLQRGGNVQWGRQPLHLYEDSDHGAHYHQGHSHRCAHRDRSIRDLWCGEFGHVHPDRDNRKSRSPADDRRQYHQRRHGGLPAPRWPRRATVAPAAAPSAPPRFRRSGTAYRSHRPTGRHDISAAAQASISVSSRSTLPHPRSRFRQIRDRVRKRLIGCVLNGLRQDVSRPCVRIERSRFSRDADAHGHRRSRQHSDCHEHVLRRRRLQRRHVLLQVASSFTASATTTTATVSSGIGGTGATRQWMCSGSPAMTKHPKCPERRIRSGCHSGFRRPIVRPRVPI